MLGCDAATREPEAELSPILLRPIREQVEHDRVIRQLQARWRRRYAVGANAGTSQETTIRIAGQDVHPDLVLTSTEGGRRLHAVVEVETTESVNHLEAMAQWARFAKSRGAFYLYVPAGMAEVAQRLCHVNGINVTEIWTYYSVGDEVRFTMAHRSAAAKRAALARKAVGGRKKTAKKSARKTAKKAGTAKVVAKKKKVTKKKDATKKTAVARSAAKPKRTRPKAVATTSQTRKAVAAKNTAAKKGRAKRAPSKRR